MSVVRLAALGVIHEANTFSARPVDEATIRRTGVLVGDEIVARHRGGTTTMAGYLDVGERDGVEVVPLVMTSLVPRGPFTAAALASIGDELVTALHEQGPFDGVVAALHGAAVADGCLDVDGYLLERFRAVVGPDVPIGVSLDLHANVSAAMCASVDVLNTYRTNPHLDARETAVEVAEIVVRAARGEVHPVVAYEPLPAVISILRQNTGEPPMRDVMDDVRATMAAPGVLSATVAEGFPYADVPEMGMAVVVVADGDAELASRRARTLGERVWARRVEFDATAPAATEAIEMVQVAPAGPILLLDAGDNIGGGGPGDSVVLLAAARAGGLERLVTIVADPAAVAACEAVGVGADVELSIGAKAHPETGPPVAATARVMAFDDGVFEAMGEQVHAGFRHLDAGRSVAVRLDTGQTVVLTSEVAPPFSIQQLTRLALRLDDFAAIVAKGVQSPLSAYGPHVADVVFVDTPGPTSADLRRFEYRHRRRPLYPFEPDATYP